MELVVLGCHGTWPMAGGATSGYLVRDDGFALWVDAGSGTLSSLQGHMGLLDVGAMVISHSHPDHLVDLYPLHYARLFSPEPPRELPLHAPPGLVERAGKLLSESGADQLSHTFSVRPVEPGGTFEAGPFRVRTAPMMHPVPTLGIRIESNGASLAYSADTGPTDELVALADGADVLLCEATFQSTGDGSPYFHLSASEAGEHAARAGAGRLLLTHLWPTNDRDQAVHSAAEAFPGPVALAEDGMTVSI